MSQEWSWRPELGKWQLREHGFPDKPTKVAISTAAVRQRDAYDFWREIAFTDFTADPATPEARHSFMAAAAGVTSSEADFFTSKSDAVSGGRNIRHIDSDGLDSISVGLVLHGSRRAEDSSGQIVSVAGGTFVYDAARPGTVAWSRHRAAYLVIRRTELEAAIGGPPPGTAQLASRLEQSGLRHVLRDQFQLLSRHLELLAPEHQAFMVRQLKDLALWALRPTGDAQPGSPGDSHLFNSALAYIERNIADPNLNAARIVRAMGCSRATLYRTFAERGLGVAEAVRDMRLDHVRAALEQTPPTAAVADVATRFGLYDSANFSRQFRRRFGVAPSDVRRPR